MTERDDVALVDIYDYLLKVGLLLNAGRAVSSGSEKLAVSSTSKSDDTKTRAVSNALE